MEPAIRTVSIHNSGNRNKQDSFSRSWESFQHSGWVYRSSADECSPSHLDTQNTIKRSRNTETGSTLLLLLSVVLCLCPQAVTFYSWLKLSFTNTRLITCAAATGELSGLLWFCRRAADFYQLHKQPDVTLLLRCFSDHGISFNTAV